MGRRESRARELGSPSDALERGLAAHRRGELEPAWSFYVQALKERPGRALAAYHLGLVQIARGMGRSALPFLLRAVLLQPEVAHSCEALLYARLHSRRLAALESFLTECEGCGVAIDTSRWREWLRQCRDGLDPSTLQIPLPPLADPDGTQEPADPRMALRTETEIHAGLKAPFARVLAHYGAGRMQDLVVELDGLLEEHPQWGEGHHLHGLGLVRLGQLTRAAGALRRAAELLPGRAEVWDHLGIALGRLDDDEGLIDAYEQSLALDPIRPESWSNAADAAIARERFIEGYQYACVAMSLVPQHQAQHEAFVFNLGRAAKGLGKLGLARRAFDTLLRDRPEHAGAEKQLGELCLETGDHAGAIEHFNRVLAFDPENHTAHSGLIFLNNYLGTESQASLYERAQRYASLLGKGVQARAGWPNTPAPGRTLRVGFVSGDLRNHPVGYFFSSVIEQLARSSALELLAYPTTRQADGLTARIRTCFDHWKPIAGLDDDEASARILADRIDILVDLSGHTGRHRLGVFARKPAPVQVTWLGYFGTTGLTQIDYLVAGPRDVPVAEASRFSERIWRLPHTRLCFARPQAEVAVAALPASGSGEVAFGCFSNLRKLNDRVIRLWARILASVAGSRLFLKCTQLGGEQVRAATAERFRAAGLDPARLILEGPSRLEEYLAAYSRVDIALDPFPYTGGTTSIQALWMGVPVLTLAGDRLLSRQGESMLRALGLDEWVAQEEAGYVERAVDHARSFDELSTLRAGLRARLEASPLMDAARCAGDLEAAFRGMWSRWYDQVADREMARALATVREDEDGSR